MGWFPRICFQWWIGDAWPHWLWLHHTPICTWVRRSDRSTTYAHARVWKGQDHVWEPLVCRWASACLSMLPNWSSVKLCRTLLGCRRGVVPRTLMDRYSSWWYGHMVLNLQTNRAIYINAFGRLLYIPWVHPSSRFVVALYSYPFIYVYVYIQFTIAMFNSQQKYAITKLHVYALKYVCLDHGVRLSNQNI